MFVWKSQKPPLKNLSRFGKKKWLISTIQLVLQKYTRFKEMRCEFQILKWAAIVRFEFENSSTPYPTKYSLSFKCDPGQDIYRNEQSVPPLFYGVKTTAVPPLVQICTQRERENGLRVQISISNEDALWGCFDGSIFRVCSYILNRLGRHLLLKRKIHK